jgi:hypothetical protein
MSIASLSMSGFAKVWNIYWDVLYLRDGCSEITGVSIGSNVYTLKLKLSAFLTGGSRNCTALKELRRNLQQNMYYRFSPN